MIFGARFVDKDMKVEIGADAIVFGLTVNLCERGCWFSHVDNYRTIHVVVVQLRGWR